MRVELPLHLPELLSRIEVPDPRLRRQGRWSLAYVLTAIAIVGSTALPLTSCTPAPMPSEILHKNQTATAEALPHGGQLETPDVNPERAATAEATATETPKTPTPEKKPFFSKLFPGIDISNAEIIPYTDATGSYDLVAVDLPPRVTLKTSDKAIDFSSAPANPPFSGSWAGYSNENGTGIAVIGNYRLLKDAPALTGIAKDEPFGETIETDHKNPGGKTIIIRLSRRNPETKKWFTPKEEVEKYFPKIYSKTTAETINYDGPIKAIVTHHYSGGPQDP